MPQVLHIRQISSVCVGARRGDDDGGGVGEGTFDKVPGLPSSPGVELGRVDAAQTEAGESVVAETEVDDDVEGVAVDDAQDAGDVGLQAGAVGSHASPDSGAGGFKSDDVTGNCGVEAEESVIRAPDLVEAEVDAGGTIVVQAIGEHTIGPGVAEAGTQGRRVVTDGGAGVAAGFDGTLQLSCGPLIVGGKPGVSIELFLRSQVNQSSKVGPPQICTRVQIRLRDDPPQTQDITQGSRA